MTRRHGARWVRSDARASRPAPYLIRGQAPAQPGRSPRRGSNPVATPIRALARWPRAGDTDVQRQSPVVSQRPAAAGLLLDMPGRPGSGHRIGVYSALEHRDDPGSSPGQAIRGRKVVPIWASRRSGNGRTWRPSGPRRICWACIRSWRCWRTGSIERVACQYAVSPGDKQQATFSDAVAAVRYHPWEVEHFSTSPVDTERVEIPRVSLQCLMQAVCYTH